MYRWYFCHLCTQSFHNALVSFKHRLVFLPFLKRYENIQLWHWYCVQTMYLLWTNLRVIIITCKIGLRYCNHSKCALIRFLTRFFCAYMFSFPNAAIVKTPTVVEMYVCGKNGEWLVTVDSGGKKNNFQGARRWHGEDDDWKACEKGREYSFTGRWKTFFFFHLRLCCTLKLNLFF